MVLGVRPEHLSVHQSCDRVDNTFSATVNVVEPLGAIMDVYLTNDANAGFVANVEPHIELKVDDVVRMRVDSEKIHIFESGEVGKNVTAHE